MDWRNDLAEEGVSLLPEVYQQPRIQALLLVAGRRWQLLEDSLRTLEEGWRLDEAEGAQLDGLGELLLEERGALTDEEYRLRLRARIHLLRGSATPDEVLGLMLLLQPQLTHRVVEYYPATAEVFTTGGPLPLPAVHSQLLQLAKPAGVRLVLRYQETEDADAFRFDSDVPGLGFSGRGTVVDAFEWDVNVGGGNAPTASLIGTLVPTSSFSAVVEVVDPSPDYTISYYFSFEDGMTARYANMFPGGDVAPVPLMMPDGVTPSGLYLEWTDGDPYASGDFGTVAVTIESATGGRFTGALG